jgi:CRP-like cAMP-binding protein
MSFHCLKRELRQKVRNHYRSISKRHILFDEKSILEDLPYTIRAEVSGILREQLLAKIPFLSNKPIVREFAARMHIEAFSNGQIVIPAGYSCTKFFVIDKGEVEVKPEHNKIRKNELPAKLGEGDYFGESNLLQKTFSQPVSCNRDAQFFTLTKAQCEAVLGVDDCRPYADAVMGMLQKRHEEMQSTFVSLSPTLCFELARTKQSRWAMEGVQELVWNGNNPHEGVAHDSKWASINGDLSVQNWTTFAERLQVAMGEGLEFRMGKLEKSMAGMLETQANMMKEQASQIEAIHKLLAKQTTTESVQLC